MKHERTFDLSSVVIRFGDRVIPVQAFRLTETREPLPEVTQTPETKTAYMRRLGAQIAQGMIDGFASDVIDTEGVEVFDVPALLEAPK